MRALFPLALASVLAMLLGCRDKPRATPEGVPVLAEEAAVDSYVNPVDELLDGGGDAPPLRAEVTVAVAKIEPKSAYAKLDLADQRWRFQRCYEAPGEVAVTVRVGEGGEAISATGNACIAEAAKRISFAEPYGGIATVELTLKFVAK